MALTDVNKHFPRLLLNRPVERDDLLNYIQKISTYSSADAAGMLEMLRELVLFYLSEGTPLRIDGVGIFSPSLKLNGRIAVRFRPDNRLVNELNSTRTYRGKYKNKKNIGKSLADLRALAENG